MSQLTLSFEADEWTDTNRLGVEVCTEDFSGRGRGWIDRASVVDFASNLSNYPFTPENPVILAMGFNTLQGDDLIGRIEIGPADRLGNLYVKVEIANYHDRWQRVRTEFRTNYPDLERFQFRLRRLLAEGEPPAVLNGS